jgi:hypothetical protein
VVLGLAPFLLLAGPARRRRLHTEQDSHLRPRVHEHGSAAQFLFDDLLCELRRVEIAAERSSAIPSLLTTPNERRTCTVSHGPPMRKLKGTTLVVAAGARLVCSSLNLNSIAL